MVITFCAESDIDTHRVRFKTVIIALCRICNSCRIQINREVVVMDTPLEVSVLK